MDKPRGMLVTGGIGSIFFAVAWAVFISMGAAVFAMVTGGGFAPGEGDASLFGGLALLAFVMLLAGGFLQGIGFFGLGKMYGGTFGVAGVLTLLVSVSLIAAVVGALVQSQEILQYATFGIFGAMILGALLGGLGFLTAKGKAASGGGTLAFAGLLLLIGGLAAIIMVVLGLARVGVPEIVGQILGYAALGGMLLGHIGATIAFFGQRS